MFGLQRSGTNYLLAVIRTNFPVETTKGEAGWVHGFPDEKRRGGHGRKRQPESIRRTLETLNITPVVVRKDLDRWVKSIRRQPQQVEDVTGFTWDDPEATWRRFYEAWSFAPTLRYGDFIEDFESAVEALGDRLGVKPVSLVEPEKVPYSPHWRPEHKRRYM